VEPLAADDPRQVGAFLLYARLAAGGLGRVYLGYSPAGRAVVIKVVHPGLARDEEFLARFRNEVAAARAVSGMYTAPVVASGLDDDPPWLATVYVPGPTLDDVVARNGPLPEPALWRLATGLVEALEAIHAVGLVHRDLKPSNVLLAADGPHVINFGISRAFDHTYLTATGIVVGTSGYMSPEQAEGREAGPPSDVFSLACVLAYAATGVQPFGTGSTASILHRIVRSEPELATVPPRLRQVLEACLRKNPAERPSLSSLAITFSQGASSMAYPAGPLAEYWPQSVATVIQEATSSRPGAAESDAVPARGVQAPAYLAPSFPQGSPAPFGQATILSPEQRHREKTRWPNIRVGYFFSLVVNTFLFVGSSLRGLIFLILKQLLLLFRLLAEVLVSRGDLAVIRADPATLRTSGERFIEDQIDRAYLALGPPPGASSLPSGGRFYDGRD
jgi:serine/threonine protein kinase